MVDKWVFATKNPHKFSEVQAILGEGILLAPLPSDAPEAPEPYHTLYENALAKAAFYADWLGGAQVIAEDSGLFVPALGGQPGVRSARFGGPQRLLEVMTGISNRKAYFVAVVIAYCSSGAYWFETAVWHGSIAETLQGEEGFGYDPVFIPEGETRTVAQLGDAWKRRHSHRSRAFHRLLARIRGE